MRLSSQKSEFLITKLQRAVIALAIVFTLPVWGTVPIRAAGEGPPSASLQQIIDQLQPTDLGCPCDIRGMATWAGWDTPGCFINIIFFQMDSGDDFLPSVVVARLDPLSGPNTCRTYNDNETEVDFVTGMSDAQLAACLEDFNQLAIDLGYIQTCLID